MKYEWEAEAERMVRASCGVLRKYEVIGVAVTNTETGEAAYFEYQDDLEGVELADYLKDIRGDVNARYDEAVENMMEKTK